MFFFFTRKRLLRTPRYPWVLAMSGWFFIKTESWILKAVVSKDIASSGKDDFMAFCRYHFQYPAQQLITQIHRCPKKKKRWRTPAHAKALAWRQLCHKVPSLSNPRNSSTSLLSTMSTLLNAISCRPQKKPPQLGFWQSYWRQSQNVGQQILPQR